MIEALQLAKETRAAYAPLGVTSTTRTALEPAAGALTSESICSVVHVAEAPPQLPSTTKVRRSPLASVALQDSAPTLTCDSGARCAYLLVHQQTNGLLPLLLLRQRRRRR